MSYYFDAVLDNRMHPVFNGTPAETKSWLLSNAPEYNDLYQVCVGKSMQIVTVADYLRGTKK